MAYCEETSGKVGAFLASDANFNLWFWYSLSRSDTEKEFESRLQTIIREFKLDRVDWLTYIYSIYDKWRQAYFKDAFWQGWGLLDDQRV